MNDQKRRYAQARALMREHGCSRLLISDPVDVEYLSSFHSSYAFILLSRGTKTLVTDSRYQEEARRFLRKNPSWRSRIIAAGDCSFVAGRSGEKAVIGFQSDVVTVDQLHRFKKAAPRARFVPIPACVSDLASSKSKRELLWLEQAARAGEKALALLRRRLQKGISEQEAAALLDMLCARFGSQRPAFPTIVLFGPRTAMPHGRPGHTRLKKGDLVLIDFGCACNGFCSDMTRTFVCGRANARQKRIHAIVANAQEQARAAVRPGAAARTIDQAGRSVIDKAGFGKSFGHSLGHGLGRRVHESPHISAASKDLLQEGNVIAIEPGIYLPGFGGVRIEDMVLVTGTGFRPLTRFCRDLIELPAGD
ncbi:MAG: aminopeptidase P family protein [Chitinispirillaceae bacterium]|nr:aminopeptidase P family protein [Chitinispirillaceae bacterium]